MIEALPHSTNSGGREWVDTLTTGKHVTVEIVQHVSAGPERDAHRTVRAASEAFSEWLDSTPKERADMLVALTDAMDEHRKRSRRSSSPMSASRS